MISERGSFVGGLSPWTELFIAGTRVRKLSGDTSVFSDGESGTQ